MATTKTLTKKSKKTAGKKLSKPGKASLKAIGKPSVKAIKKPSVKAISKPSIKGAITTTARVILYVSDFDRALAFYTKTLGFELSYPTEGGWAEFKTGQASICIHAGREGTVTTKGISSVGFAVDDFDKTYANLKTRGVVLGDVFKPCGDLRVSSFCDPDGNELSIEGL